MVLFAAFEICFIQVLAKFESRFNCKWIRSSFICPDWTAKLKSLGLSVLLQPKQSLLEANQELIVLYDTFHSPTRLFDLLSVPTQITKDHEEDVEQVKRDVTGFNIFKQNRLVDIDWQVSKSPQEISSRRILFEAHALLAYSNLIGSTPLERMYASTSLLVKLGIRENFLFVDRKLFGAAFELPQPGKGSGLYPFYGDRAAVSSYIERDGRSTAGALHTRLKKVKTFQIRMRNASQRTLV